ncbi:hepatocellular carcinoma-associated antigen 59-domain-containing protein [Staphylotrichum tortipilum]|uniref:Hepatocellular carcinoma-associated antigen 59-domain-containing protein n=1 Tax=Staphylotrichum tortipilum TaxID=2831512 RepID=A0AAN6MP17_9PEZI|nr:hepatocellular carcinoma-associated antigen 59-domain-containing protein [Staphylotrichum longicolle]
MASIDETGAAPQVLFRPGKKRKNYRQRAEQPDDTPSTGATPTEANTAEPTRAVASPVEPAQDEPEERPSVAEALRLRNARKHKHGGVGFRAGRTGPGDERASGEDNTEQGLVLHGNADAQQAADVAVIGGISTRFAPQTGMVGDLVNRHMEEYVESELARRKRHAAEAAAQEGGGLDQQTREDGTISLGPDGRPSSAAFPTPQGDSQRVLHGRLLEIDLGDEARARNIAMTERARRRLQGQIDEDDQESSGTDPPRKVRLGRDGRPLRPRNRRGSDDIKRDELVDQFLSENRLDIYQTPADHQPPTTLDDNNIYPPDDDEAAADDRIAEEFRRDFMEAMAQRNRRRRAPAPASKSAPREEILRGPKLGGSRNERSAMRDILLKEQVSRKQQGRR